MVLKRQFQSKLLHKSGPTALTSKGIMHLQRTAVHPRETGLAALAGGRSLAEQAAPSPVRRALEARFGHDFGQVRVHTGGPAAQLAQSLGAEALTFGHEIAFRPGAFDPQSCSGARLLAHELAHVAQQSGLDGSLAQAPQVSHRSGAYQRLEQDAERVASQSVVPGDPAIAQEARQSPLPEPKLPLFQLYAVPGSLRCDEVVDWLNANSPYAPEWAETRSTYSFNGGVNTTSRTLPDGTVEIHARGHNGLTVSVSSPVDMPSWSPNTRPNQQAEAAAWSAMITVLSAHEQNHRQIAATWRTTLQSNWRGVDFTVTGASAAEAQQNAVAELESQKAGWGQLAQNAQDAIDPFRGAILNCPSSPAAPQQDTQETSP